MIPLALVLLIGQQSVADPTLTPTFKMQFLIQDANHRPVAVCSMKDEDTLDACTLEEGYTLKDALQVMLTSSQLSNKYCDERIKPYLDYAEAVRKIFSGKPFVSKKGEPK